MLASREPQDMRALRTDIVNSGSFCPVHAHKGSSFAAHECFACPKVCVVANLAREFVSCDLAFVASFVVDRLHKPQDVGTVRADVVVGVGVRPIHLHECRALGTHECFESREARMIAKGACKPLTVNVELFSFCIAGQKPQDVAALGAGISICIWIVPIKS